MEDRLPETRSDEENSKVRCVICVDVMQNQEENVKCQIWRSWGAKVLGYAT